MQDPKIKFKINTNKETMKETGKAEATPELKNDENLDAASLKKSIANALSNFHREGDLHEMRILNTDQGVVSGYFDELEKMAEQALMYDGKHNIFMTLNPVKEELKARSPNQLTVRAKQTTADSDIASIKYILIDLDPKRPAGVSATNKEKLEAKNLAEKIKEYLKEQGFPEPFFADSGNGYHLILPVELENTKENVQMLKQFLEALHFRFSTNMAEVDRTTFNPARITKVYGTMACKGENTEERPHRRSELLSVPDEVRSATIDHLKSVVSILPEVKRKEKSAKKKWDIPAFIEKHGLDLAYVKPYNKNDTIYVLKTCPWNPEHTNSSAFIIQFANGGVDSGCHHDKCKDEDWNSLKKICGETNASGEKEVKQSDVILSLLNDCQLIQTNGEAYAVVDSEDSRVVYQLKSKKFSQFMLKRYYEAKHTAPGSEAINQALAILEMKASFDGSEEIIHRRVGRSDDGVYFYDLNNGSQYVRIDADSAKLVQKPEVCFFQSKNMNVQVIPDLETEPEMLFELIKNHFRIQKDADVILFSSYLVTCLIPDIPHPIMILFGEKGSSKSTSMRMIKRIIDPARQDLLVMPTSKDDLALILANHYMPCFDNMAALSAALSDMLCMASTGGAFSKRTLYTDSDETILEFLRCVVLNGINIVATQPDLLDRSFTTELSRIRTDERRPEDIIFKEFADDLPKILGALFNALSKAISIRETLTLERVGRMADFTYWGYAIAEVIGIGGELFLEAYLENQNRANEEALASNPVATAVIALMRGTFQWSSSVSRLMYELEIVAETEKINTRQKIWPKEANVLSRRLNEVKSNLEEVGIQYEVRPAGDYKKITITNENNRELNTIVEPDAKVPGINVAFSIGKDMESLKKVEPLNINEMLK